MPTANRRHFIPSAIRLFHTQDYANKQLLIVDDGEDSVADLIPLHPQITYIRKEGRSRVGAKRNFACDIARGEIILHWDDDDWYAPWRIRYQVEALESESFDICGIDRVFFADTADEEAWEYVYPRGTAQWVCGATLCYRKSFWQKHQFVDVARGEDTRFVLTARGARVGVLEDNRFFVARIHSGNTSRKRTSDRRWQARSVDAVRTIVGSAWENHFGGKDGLPLQDVGSPAGSALITAASGIGDILRVTPLIRVAHRLGYAVDVLLAPDDPATAELLRGAQEIRHLFNHPEVLQSRASPHLTDLEDQRYEIATFTGLSARLARFVRADARYSFDRGWRFEGDVVAVEKLARSLGWRGNMPAPFAMKSARRFDIPPDTIAIHPGCKPNWPWKKWHGFDQLANLFQNVAIVGTTADLDNRGTYFEHPFMWPESIQDFVGKLDLQDTAALLSQCAALVSLDSGLMHLGVALNVPTFGIFGITSPQRECIKSPFMIPIAAQMTCQPTHRDFGRTLRDRQNSPDCLKSLTAEAVAVRVTSELSSRTAFFNSRVLARRKSTAPITLNYHGEVSCASGYGQAAREYIHALHAAGVRVCVVDTGPRSGCIADQLSASLVGYNPDATFNIFHGIPSMWARSAYQMRNVIAMTVWEADQIPQMWRNPLGHAIDVWVPSVFNLDGFAQALSKAPYRLPHVLPFLKDVPSSVLSGTELNVEPTDFVFYSIFEWQERKNPRGLFEAFLNAFRDESDAVLVVKTNERARATAHDTLSELRKQTQSRGRIVLCCEYLDERQMQGLQTRGDCYVSLHRGEGWGYPLFEAAGRGKAVVASAYGGPADYLDPQRHWLVRCTVAPIRDPYFLYKRSMRWAEPDLSHASEGLRWVHEHRSEARSAAKEAARELQNAYSPDRIGNDAKARLLELAQDIATLSSTAPSRRISSTLGQKRVYAPTLERASAMVPTLPISGEWYDADYFERGLKSNWRRGYHWSSFEGLFTETAAFLNEAFPAAKSYVDAGCAKGFLVQALRKRGLDARGFDHSSWAIGQADPGTRRFLDLASVETARYDEGSVDVLVAMSIFESLTDPQIKSFLQRALCWVRSCIFATMPIQAPHLDRDLSHITMHDNHWWCERFEENGWRLHSLHEHLKAEPLPLRMGWDVCVFEPRR
jgi:glycosyltransferase involved in cell wall biosynthesis